MKTQWDTNSKPSSSKKHSAENIVALHAELKKETKSSSLFNPVLLPDLPAGINPTAMPTLTTAPDPLVLQTTAPAHKSTEARSLPSRLTSLLGNIPHPKVAILIVSTIVSGGPGAPSASLGATMRLQPAGVPCPTS
eukprot:15351164-Ditylum_brightwellii.AAC.1